MIKSEAQKIRDNAYFATFDREINDPLSEREGITGAQLLIMLIAVSVFFFLLYITAHDIGIIRW